MSGLDEFQLARRWELNLGPFNDDLGVERGEICGAGRNSEAWELSRSQPFKEGGGGGGLGGKKVKPRARPWEDGRLTGES